MTYLRGREVADRYGWSLAYVQERARQHLLPHRVIPSTRTVLYPTDWLEAWENGAELELILLPRGGRIVRPTRSDATPELHIQENRE